MSASMTAAPLASPELDGGDWPALLVEPLDKSRGRNMEITKIRSHSGNIFRWSVVVVVRDRDGQRWHTEKSIRRNIRDNVGRRFVRRSDAQLS